MQKNNKNKKIKICTILSSYAIIFTTEIVFSYHIILKFTNFGTCSNVEEATSRVVRSCTEGLESDEREIERKREREREKERERKEE